ncbi:MAG: hypothetical protein JSU58_10300 [Dehalococcoidales bacterium]|nr:MAG: hypothetical protein JSU58_10300 [Dehalococcoidales bacterium]
MIKFLAVLSVACLLITGLGACKAEQETLANNPDEVVITLERTACHGFCPIYSLTIHGDGTVIYEGEDFVKTVGRANSVISKEKVEQLISEFEKVDYDSLKNAYTEKTITDAPTVITSITRNGKTKTVEHYHGDFSAPEKLTELEDKVDEIVNSEQWVQ